jgi:glycerol kinase
MYHKAMNNNNTTYVMAFDSGTTSCRAMIFDHHGKILGTAQQEFPQIYPEPGWVEHDPMEIWACQSAVARQVLEKHQIRPGQIEAIGITNQRETTLLWDKSTGKPIYNALVWQDKRTAPLCEQLKTQGHSELIRSKTGLVVDSYFSGSKIAWILDQVPGARKKAAAGELLFGTIDTWLIWNLTRGERHVTDVTNASRTMIFNINTLEWDQELIDLLKIPRSILPEVVQSSEVVGTTHEQSFGGARIPIAGIAGDQQAALFGQTCFSPGQGKNTYGTGSFILMNTGEQPIFSSNGLLTTIGWKINGLVTYALEGSVFITGAAVQWLRDELKVIRDARDTEYFAQKVEDTGGVYMVPAFAGLGAPYWDMYARGILVGLTRGTTMDHIIRATMESLAYQVRDVSDLMARDSGIPLKNLRVDGGASANNFLMQFQADVLGVPIQRPKNLETTALGAAFLAGLAVGYWKNPEDLKKTMEIQREFQPQMGESRRNELYSGWQRAVDRSRGWAQ